MIKMHIYVQYSAEHTSVLFISGILDANCETTTFTYPHRFGEG